MDVDVDVDKSHYIHESGCTHFVSCRMGMMPCITRFSVSMKIYSRKSMNVMLYLNMQGSLNMFIV